MVKKKKQLQTSSLNMALKTAKVTQKTNGKEKETLTISSLNIALKIAEATCC